MWLNKPKPVLFDEDRIYRGLGYGISSIIMCEGCGGLFDRLSCTKEEKIRRPHGPRCRNRTPWLDFVYFCKHCKPRVSL